MTEAIENKNKFTSLDLKTMQDWDLDRKIATSLAKIAEFNTHFDNKTYISFSGGKDSTVVLDLARRVFPEIPAVFADTGLEYPEIRNFVKQTENVTWLKPEMTFRQVIEHYGYPVISKEIANKVAYAKPGNTRWRQFHGGIINPATGEPSVWYNYTKWRFLLDAQFKISDQCCAVMKKRPALKFEKKTGMHPITGMMACESTKRRLDYLKTGCNAFDKKHPQSQPLGFWTEQDVLEYIKRFDIPYASVYGEILQDDNGKYYTTGCNRTGCVFCAFGCHLEKEPNRFQTLKQTHPQLWNYCMKPWDEGGLGMEKVLDYIGVKTK